MVIGDTGVLEIYRIFCAEWALLSAQPVSFMYRFGAFMTLMCPIYAPRFDLLFSAMASGTKLLHVSNSAVSFVPKADVLTATSLYDEIGDEEAFLCVR